MLNDECRNKVFSDQFVSNTVVSRWLFVSLVRLTALDTLIGGQQVAGGQWPVASGQGTKELHNTRGDWGF